MPEYPVCCYAVGCDAPALYKIAAGWSDGVTCELKTYSLCCVEHLRSLFHDARDRHARCRITSGETLEDPGIYDWTRGNRDPSLCRRRDLEQEMIR